MAWIDCELTQTFESGDHYIAIGRVQQLEATEFGAAGAASSSKAATSSWRTGRSRHAGLVERTRTFAAA